LLLLLLLLQGTHAMAVHTEVSFAKGWYAAETQKASPAQLNNFTLNIDAGNHAPHRIMPAVVAAGQYLSPDSSRLYSGVVLQGYAVPYCKSYLLHIHPYHHFW